MIPTQHHNKLGAKSRRCLFFGYSNTSRSYRLYDEENKKFIVSRDVVFLEFDKDDSIVDRQLSHLNKFHSKKFYYEWDNELPHPKGGIQILDESMDFPSINFPYVSSPENEGKLDDNNDSVEEEIVG